MVILVTGAKGFVGRNLVTNLREIKDGRNKTRPAICIDEIIEFDVDSVPELLEEACRRTDFVFNLAGVNRPKDASEFMNENCGFVDRLLKLLKSYSNKCPVMLSSSVQATLVGRFSGSEYGMSKLASERALFKYGSETGAKVLVYRFPNIFGKWCRPRYNSAVATFCNAVANDEDYVVDDESTELELLYIDDLVEEMLDALEGKEHRCNFDGLNVMPDQFGKYCYVPTTYQVTLGEIVRLLDMFNKMPVTLDVPLIMEGSFEKKLYSTYLSYLPAEKIIFNMESKIDNRGCFTELIKTVGYGQVSVNISKPGVAKGQHWHNSKWELFIVVSGHALIQERRIGVNPETKEPYPIIEFEVSGERIQAVHMIPGYTHNIINLSSTENLVTVMWANETFDINHPDTFYEPV